MIPDEAIEAAARSLDPRTMGSGGALAEKFKEQARAEARAALEAAAPYIRAEAVRAAATGWSAYQSARMPRSDVLQVPIWLNLRADALQQPSD